jgi:hypothetical protein
VIVIACVSGLVIHAIRAAAQQRKALASFSQPIVLELVPHSATRSPGHPLTAITASWLLAVLTSWLGGGRRDFVRLDVVSLFANDIRQSLGSLLYFFGQRSFHPLDPHLLHDHEHEQSRDRDERHKRADSHAEPSRRCLITHRDLSIICGDMLGIRSSVTVSTRRCMGDVKTRAIS